MSKSVSLLLVVCVACVACARRLPMPMTAAQLADEPSGQALVAYLGQRDASPTVCDLGASGPHVAAVDADVRDALMDGLRDERGAGGRGGAGGSAGGGTTCFESDGRTSTVSGGMPGLNGNDGRSGLAGGPGSNGRGGTVTVRVVE